MATQKRFKGLSAILKVSISAILIYLIFTKIDFKAVADMLRFANPFWLLAATLLFILSKIINAFRLKLYFHTIAVAITQLSNLKLYLLGMFYNLFLPGGIGGDAYKAYVIKKRFPVKTKKLVSVLLLDRLNGMILITVYSCLLATQLQSPFFQRFEWFFWFLIPLEVGLFWMINKLFFPYVLSVFWGSLGYSALIQFIQLAATFCIFKALNLTGSLLAYLFIFMISSIVSVVPLTVGGVGSREVAFLYGAKWLALDAHSAIGISIIFFAITAVVSFLGIGYHFKKPDLIATEN